MPMIDTALPRGGAATSVFALVMAAFSELFPVVAVALVLGVLGCGLGIYALHKALYAVEVVEQLAEKQGAAVAGLNEQADEIEKKITGE